MCVMKARAQRRTVVLVPRPRADPIADLLITNESPMHEIDHAKGLAACLCCKSHEFRMFEVIVNMLLHTTR
jgi:hypothetical protein